MKSAIRTALLGGLAMLALSLAATGVAAAATTPEFKPVPSKKKFTITGGESVWATSGPSITCSKSTTSGEITSATTVGDVIVKYTGCSVHNNLTGEVCPVKSAAGGKEEILMNALKGELGTIVPKPTRGSEVGLLLQPEVKTLWATLESACDGSAALTGSLAGSVEMPDGKTGTINYAAPGGVQAIKEMKLDSGTVAKPRWAAFGEQWTLATADTLKFEESLEVT
jgi:hypothetical protein